MLAPGTNKELTHFQSFGHYFSVLCRVQTIGCSQGGPLCPWAAPGLDHLPPQVGPGLFEHNSRVFQRQTLGVLGGQYPDPCQDRDLCLWDPLTGLTYMFPECGSLSFLCPGATLGLNWHARLCNLSAWTCCADLPSFLSLILIFLPYVTSQLAPLSFCPYSGPGPLASLACLMAQLPYDTTYFLGFGGQQLRSRKLINQGMFVSISSRRSAGRGGLQHCFKQLRALGHASWLRQRTMKAPACHHLLFPMCCFPEPVGRGLLGLF